MHHWEYISRLACKISWLGSELLKCRTLVLNEFLDYLFMAKAVARSASRALGLLIVKSKTHGGFQHNSITKLFDTLVW
jgi:hypothetical protein